MGLTSRGVIAIHADWPMYPWEHGWLMALVNLCCFPTGTTFTEISDIDLVLLLNAEELAPTARATISSRRSAFMQRSGTRI
jgi:hypothetical protein